MSHCNSLPLRQGMLQRPRLHDLIGKGLQHPLLIMLAGPGYGKTQAMADYLTQCSTDADVLWLRINSLDNLHTHFWDHLIHALERKFAGPFAHLQTLGFPDTLAKFDIFLHILTDEICRRRQVIWVFDDFGEIHDRSIKEFFHTLAEVDIENFRFVLISNELDGTESIAFLSSRAFLILGKDLRFTRDEIAALYRMHDITLKPDELSEIERHTEGWPLPLHLLALQRDKISALISQDGRLSHHAISHMFEERFFSTYSSQRKKLLAKLSLLNFFTEELAGSLYEGEKIDLETLETHVFIAKEPALERFSFHHLYRLFLQKKLYLLTEEEEKQVWQQAAQYYAASGDVMEAVACFRKYGDHIGMLNVIFDFVRSQHGITREDAVFFSEHIDLLSPEEIDMHPIATYLRALINLNMLELEKAESLLLGLEQKLLHDWETETPALLGDTYVMLGTIHMMCCREDFGDYFRKAAAQLPEGTHWHNMRLLLTRNNNIFSMADNLPGAKERMRHAMRNSMPYISQVLRSDLSGMEHIFSAEQAYYSHQFSEAQQYAYRAIYEAEINDQHELICSGYGILARVGLMMGDFAEMSGQMQNVVEYTGKHKFSVLREIRDVLQGWYYLSLQDYKRIPPSILAMKRADSAKVAHDRSQIIHAYCLIHAGEYARLVGMLEYPKGLHVPPGIWPERICLHILLAIGYYHLGNQNAAMKALWTAYDMAYQNGLTTPFVEAEDHMRILIGTARQQKTYAFAAEWLDLIEEQTAAFTERAAAIRTAYRKQNPGKKSRGNPLTKREMEILHALSQGLTREEIAVEQFISVNTVKTFIRSIYNKLDATNRAKAISIAISRGYLDISASE